MSVVVKKKLDSVFYGHLSQSFILIPFDIWCDVMSKRTTSFLEIIRHRLLQSGCWNICVFVKIFCQTLVTEMPSFKRNENVRIVKRTLQDFIIGITKRDLHSDSSIALKVQISPQFIRLNRTHLSILLLSKFLYDSPFFFDNSQALLVK